MPKQPSRYKATVTTLVNELKHVLAETDAKIDHFQSIDDIDESFKTSKDLRNHACKLKAKLTTFQTTWDKWCNEIGAITNQTLRDSEQNEQDNHKLSQSFDECNLKSEVCEMVALINEVVESKIREFQRKYETDSVTHTMTVHEFSNCMAAQTRNDRPSENTVRAQSSAPCRPRQYKRKRVINPLENENTRTVLNSSQFNSFYRSDGPSALKAVQQPSMPRKSINKMDCSGSASPLLANASDTQSFYRNGGSSGQSTEHQPYTPEMEVNNDGCSSSAELSQLDTATTCTSISDNLNIEPIDSNVATGGQSQPTVSDETAHVQLIHVSNTHIETDSTQQVRNTVFETLNITSNMDEENMRGQSQQFSIHDKSPDIHLTSSFAVQSHNSEHTKHARMPSRFSIGVRSTFKCKMKQNSYESSSANETHDQSAIHLDHMHEKLTFAKDTANSPDNITVNEVTLSTTVDKTDSLSTVVPIAHHGYNRSQMRKRMKDTANNPQISVHIPSTKVDCTLDLVSEKFHSQAIMMRKQLKDTKDSPKRLSRRYSNWRHSNRNTPLSSYKRDRSQLKYSFSSRKAKYKSVHRRYERRSGVKHTTASKKSKFKRHSRSLSLSEFLILGYMPDSCSEIHSDHTNQKQSKPQLLLGYDMPLSSSLKSVDFRTAEVVQSESPTAVYYPNGNVLRTEESRATTTNGLNDMAHRHAAPHSQLHAVQLHSEGSQSNSPEAGIYRGTPVPHLRADDLQSQEE